MLQLFLSTSAWPVLNNLKGPRSSREANPLSSLTQNCLLTALMLRLIMQDDESEARGARLPEKAVFVDELFSSMSAINIFLEVEEKKRSFD